MPAINQTISFPSDNITREDLNMIAPFGNTADIIEITGKVLKEAFEHGVGSVEDQKGRFPQVSGKKRGILKTFIF